MAGMEEENAVAAIDEVEDALYPIAVLLDELKNESVTLRLNATARIKTIAKALGPERTRSELIPFLTETVDDEDEVLMTLAGELGDFIEEIGGVQYAPILTDALEALSAIEETMVREKAVESLKRISDATVKGPDGGKDFHVNYLFPMVKRLATGDWFTIRISACALLPPCYSRLPKEAEGLRSECLVMFKALAEDETPMVRRAATCNIGMMAKAVSDHDALLVEKEILPIFKQLARDEQDSVRLLIVEMAADIARLLPKQINDLDGGDDVDMGQGQESLLIDTDMVPIAKTCVGDSSWRVRYMVADKLPTLCHSFGPRATWKDLVPLYITLLRDAEPEVRAAASYKVSEIVIYIINLPDEKIPQPIDGPKVTALDLVTQHILPILKDLVADPSQHVRAACASNIMGLTPALSKVPALKDILDLVLILMRDEVADVRLNVISHLDLISSALGPEKLNRELMPAILNLAHDKNWRVRSAIIRYMPVLAKNLGKEFFTIDNALGVLCTEWLRDTIYAIRRDAMDNLKILTAEFGSQWASENVVPQVVAMYSDKSSHVSRITALSTMAVLSELVGAEVFEKAFLPTLTEGGCKDPVPNVRFTAVKTLDKAMSVVGPSVRESKIRPCLMELVGKTEPDEDVKFYASQALKTLSACG